MNRKEKTLKKKFPYVWQTLITRHDDDFDYCEELMEANDMEGAGAELGEINEIRRFFGDDELTLDEIGDDLYEPIEGIDFKTESFN